MKKLIVLMSLFCMVITARSQQLKPGSITLTPCVGANLSSYYGEDNEGCDYKLRAVMGVEGEYYIKDWLGISAGLMYSQEGTTVSDPNFNGDILVDYINVPLLCNFHFGKCFSIKTGLEPCFKLSSKVRSQGITVDLDRSGIDAKNLDIAMPMGMSFAISNFTIDARYSIGLINVFKGQISDINYNSVEIYNSVFSLTFGYKFKLK